MKAFTLALCATLALAAPRLALSEAAPPPTRVDAPIERVQKQLVQVDVVVEPFGTRGLGPSDFRVAVGGREIENVTVDDLCHTGPGASSDAFSAAPASLVFYFDQLQLSPAGRVRAIAVARELVPQLIVGNNRAMVVSNADRVRVVESWTSDPAAIIAALDDLEADPTQFDASVALESIQTDRLARAMADEVLLSGGQASAPAQATDFAGLQSMAGGGGEVPSGKRRRTSSRRFGEIGFEGARIDARSLGYIERSVNEATGAVTAGRTITGSAAVALAREFQREEMQRANKSAERLAAVLAGLAETNAPKAIVYFADAFRKNPGDHYFQLLEQAAEGNRLGESGRMDTYDFRAAHPHAIDFVIAPILREAAAKGVKFFTVQAEGLAETTARTDDARSTLAAMALETGGDAYLNGVSAATIAERLTGRLSCAYLLSFDRTGFAEDTPLRVDVSVSRPGVKVRAPGTIVVESESRRATSRLIAAAVGAAHDEGPPLRVGMIPLGWRDGRYSALVQIVAPAHGALQDWELGVTLASYGTVTQTKPRRITAQGTASVILESKLEFGSGLYELVGLGRHITADRVTGSRSSNSWPDPEDALASVSPVAIVQPSSGVFIRGAEEKTRGLLVVPEGDLVDPKSAVAIVAVVCRAGDGPRTLRARRKLMGESAVHFPETQLDLTREQCAQIRDVVEARTLGGGRFTYSVELLDRDTTLAHRERELDIADE